MIEDEETSMPGTSGSTGMGGEAEAGAGAGALEAGTRMPDEESTTAEGGMTELVITSDPEIGTIVETEIVIPIGEGMTARETATAIVIDKKKTGAGDIDTQVRDNSDKLYDSAVSSPLTHLRTAEP